MKKINSKILTFLSLAAFSAVSFFSCGFKDEGIFWAVRKEVKLSDAKISGDIQNIVRYNLNGEEHVFVSTGEIYHRSVAESVVDSKSVGFSKFSTPSGFIYALAADDSNLYAASIIIEENDDGYNLPTTRKLYCFNGSDWSEIWSTSYSDSTAAILFCTNAPQNKKEHRKAYFRYGSTVYELNGSTFPESGMTLGEDDNTTTPTANSRSCAYFNGKIYFSSAYAMTTNETASEEATAIYYSSGDNVYYKRKYTETTTTKSLSDDSENSENTEDDATSGETEEEPDNEEAVTDENETEGAESTAENGGETAQTIKITKTTVTTKEITTITTTTADGKTTTTTETRTETLEPVVEQTEQTADGEITPEEPVENITETEEETPTSEEKQTEWAAVDLNCDTILSLGVTADNLLAGTDSGIVHTPWESEGVPKSGNADFSTNADSTLSTHYEVPAILVVDPSKNEKEGTIYATSITSSSSASLNNVGLWSYYASEKKWNRE